MPGFGGGLSYCAHLVRWGDRTAPLGRSKFELPPPERTALQLIQDLLVAKATPVSDPDALLANEDYFFVLFAAAFFFLDGSFGRVLPNEPW
jgi:hypothetical protein